MIYFVQAGKGGPIKIGYAKNVALRFGVLQSSNPEKLYLLGTRPGAASDEREMRKRLTRDLIRGEWFKPSRAVLHVVAQAEPPGRELACLNEDGPLSGCRRYHCRVLHTDGTYETFDRRHW